MIELNPYSCSSVASSWQYLMHRGVQGLALLSSVKLVSQSFPYAPPLAVRSRHRTDESIRVAMEARSNLPNDAFRLMRFRDSIELQTAMYRLVPAKVDSPTEIVLIAMVHLADHAYYREIMRNASLYDRALFELIVGPGASRVDTGGRKAVIEYVYPTKEQELLARNYGLEAQLNCLNYCHLCRERIGDRRIPRWVLADLSRGEIQALQKATGEKPVGQSGWRGLLDEVTRALVLGRQAGDEILPKFFPPLGSSLNKPALVLRALLWLAPCPEAEIMLLDWARTYPRAGGLSALAPAIVERVLAGDFFTAKKLGFAQQIVSGQAGGGNWGSSDEVIVQARNSVVVEETQRALQEGCRSIMIMYGGLHMQDLVSQLSEGLEASKETTGWRTAWVVPTKPKSGVEMAGASASPAVALDVRWNVQNSVKGSLGSGEEYTLCAATSGSAEREGRVGELGDEPSDEATQWGPLVVAALAYVAVGAWDWTDTVEALERELTSGGPSAEGIGSALLVSVLYVARHAYLYYGLARWLVQWEKGLF